MTSSLFPITESVHADPNGLGKFRLRKADELAQHGDILAGLKLALHEPLSCAR